jgi:hypothetical protein
LATVIGSFDLIMPVILVSVFPFVATTDWRTNTNNSMIGFRRSLTSCDERYSVSVICMRQISISLDKYVGWKI